MSSRSLQALAFAVSALATMGVAATAQAADFAPMGAAPPPLTQQRPVELGTGWYLRGDIGFVSEKPLQLNNEANLSGKRRNLLGGNLINGRSKVVVRALRSLRLGGAQKCTVRRSMRARVGVSQFQIGNHRNLLLNGRER